MTIHLPEAEDRRIWKALTRCAASDDARPTLCSILFDGRHAYATDGSVLGFLPAPLHLPSHLERVTVSAELLRNALGLIKGKDTPAEIHAREDSLVLVIGEEPLPLGDTYGRPEVFLPYGDADDYPDTSRLRGVLDGVGRDGDQLALDMVSRLGVNAANIARVAAIARTEGSDPLVTLHPRGDDMYGTIEVRDVRIDTRLGIVARVGGFWLHRDEAEEDPDADGS